MLNYVPPNKMRYESGGSGGIGGASVSIHNPDLTDQLPTDHAASREHVHDKCRSGATNNTIIDVPFMKQ